MKEQIEPAVLAGVGAIGGALKYYVQSELTAMRAWVGIGSFVLAYEICAPTGELLSEGVDRALENHKALVVGAVCLTAAHLCNVLPYQIDPLHQAVSITRRLLDR